MEKGNAPLFDVLIGLITAVSAWFGLKLTRKKTVAETSEVDIGNAITVNKYYIEETKRITSELEDVKNNLVLCKLECDKKDELNRAQERYIHDLKQEIIVIKNQITLWETISKHKL